MPPRSRVSSSALLAYLAGGALLLFMLLVGWQFALLDRNFQQQVDLAAPVIAKHADPALRAVLEAHRAYVHMLARIAIATSLAFPPLVALWIWAFAYTVRRARIDRSNALKDSLTGVGNRRSALATLRWLARSSQSEFGVVFIDLNGFKKINDVHGHAAGDAVLRQVSARLSHELRGHDSVARLGGDEFLCIVAQPSSAAGVHAVAERLRRLVAKPYELDGDSFVLDCSVGVSIFPQDGRDEHELLERADRAMYGAKAQGGGVRTAGG